MSPRPNGQISTTVRRLSVMAVVSVMSVVTVGCGADDLEAAASGHDGPVVMATTTIWSDIVSAVACEPADGSGPEVLVEAIIDPEDDAHGSSLGLAERDRLGHADLVVVNGLGMEPNIEDLLGDIDASSLNIAEALAAAGSDLIEHNPHLWMDPVLVATSIDPLADALVAAGADRAAVDECAQAFKAELDLLDAEIVGAIDQYLESGGCRQMVTNHGSLDYLVGRYELELVGTVLPSGSALAEPDLAHLDRLAGAIEASCIETIYVDAGGHDHHADDFAHRLDLPETGIRVDQTIEGHEPGTAYLATMRANLASLVGAEPIG